MINYRTSTTTKADQKLALIILKVESHLLAPGNSNLLAEGVGADSQFLNLVAASTIIKNIT